MSRFDIEHVVNGFVETAKGAVAAGFDGVEVHGAHGYLINQFLSSYSNRREDEYGGSLASRFRLAREIIRAVRGVMPRDRLLTLRISNWGIADMEISQFRDAREWEGFCRPRRRRTHRRPVGVDLRLPGQRSARTGPCPA